MKLSKLFSGIFIFVLVLAGGVQAVYAATLSVAALETKSCFTRM